MSASLVITDRTFTNRTFTKCTVTAVCHVVRPSLLTTPHRPQHGCAEQLELINSTNSSPTLSNIFLRNQQQSPFLQLPGEIRNRVYEYTLGHQVISYQSIGTWSAEQGDYHKWGPNRLVPGTIAGLLRLPMICRQIYTETKLFVFKLNVFRVKDTNIESFINKLSRTQLLAIKTCGCPREREQVDTDRILANLRGLQTIVVRVGGNWDDREDLHRLDKNADAEHRQWSEERRNEVLKELALWQKRGINIEYWHVHRDAQPTYCVSMHPTCTHTASTPGDEQVPEEAEISPNAQG
ncbi:hypothetical protein E8E13_004548 [Curvularia kusanoi]|uniref:DUF7730 domain-containing protein n=1 Tax=Curvularia kusanoi TaxID=90978 RepID=A0A9P4TA43_CURKU|nr:hypothetical protein E8E13_004548 [Curvularia kusanoi]